VLLVLDLIYVKLLIDGHNVFLFFVKGIEVVLAYCFIFFVFSFVCNLY
jgi:hypothetical protein